MDPLTWGNGLLVRVGLYLLVFWPTVGYYIYTDLQKRGVNQPILKGIGYGVLGALGLFIYLAKREHAKAAQSPRE